MSNERIEYQKMKINSNSIKIVIVGLIIDMLYKSLILKEDFNKFLDIILIFLVLTIYVLIEYTRKGIISGKFKRNLFSSIFSSIFFAIIFGSLMYFFNKNYSYIRAIISSGIFFIIYFVILYFWKIEKKDK